MPVTHDEDGDGDTNTELRDVERERERERDVRSLAPRLGHAGARIDVARVHDRLRTARSPERARACVHALGTPSSGQRKAAREALAAHRAATRAARRRRATRRPAAALSGRRRRRAAASHGVGAVETYAENASRESRGAEWARVRAIPRQRRTPLKTAPFEASRGGSSAEGAVPPSRQMHPPQPAQHAKARARVRRRAARPGGRGRGTDGCGRGARRARAPSRAPLDVPAISRARERTTRPAASLSVEQPEPRRAPPRT
jgi:hypothetical protein